MSFQQFNNYSPFGFVDSIGLITSKVSELQASYQHPVQINVPGNDVIYNTTQVLSRYIVRSFSGTGSQDQFPDALDLINALNANSTVGYTNGMYFDFIIANNSTGSITFQPGVGMTVSPSNILLSAGEALSFRGIITDILSGSMVINLVNAPQYVPATVVGYQGAQGWQGYKGDQGQGFRIFATVTSFNDLCATNPTGSNVGEFVLITGGDLYVYMGTGAGTTGPAGCPTDWNYAGDITDESTIIGPQGNQGWQGFQGQQGVQGAQGWQGQIGYQGAQGNQGFQGFQGLVGPTGAVDSSTGAFTNLYGTNVTVGSQITINGNMSGANGYMVNFAAENLAAQGVTVGFNGLVSVGNASLLQNLYVTGTSGAGYFKSLYVENLTGPNLGLIGPQGWQGPIGPTGVVNYTSGSFGYLYASQIGVGTSLTMFTGSTLTAQDLTVKGNMSGANAYFVNLASESLASQGATIGFNGLVSVGNASLLQNLYVTGGSGAGYFDSLTVTSLSAGTVSFTGVTAGSINTTSLTATTGTITNLSSTSITATNATLTSATISGGNATLSTVTAGTGVISNLTSTNAQISGGNATLSTLTVGTGSVTTLSITTLNATGTSNVKDLNISGNMSGANGYMVNFATESLATQGATVGFNGLLSVGNVSLLQNLYVTGGSGAGYFDYIYTKYLTGPSLGAIGPQGLQGPLGAQGWQGLVGPTGSFNMASGSFSYLYVDQMGVGTSLTMFTGALLTTQDVTVKGNMSGSNAYFVNLASESLASQGATIGFNGLLSVGNVSLLQNLYVTGGSGAGYFDSLSATTFSAGAFSTTSLSAGTLTSTTGTITNLSSTNLNATNATLTTAQISGGNATLSTLTAGTGVITNLSSTNATLTTATISGGNATLSTITAGTGAITSLSVTTLNATGTSNVKDLNINGNMSGANGYMVNLASESLATQGATIGFNGMLSVGNVSLLQNLYVTGGSGAGYFDSLSATTFSAGTFSTTSLSAGTLTATTGTITNLSSTNLSATNATLTTATISGGNAILSTVTAGTGVITNLSSTNATLTTATISGGNATLSTITAGTGSITNLSVTTLNATGTSNVKDLNISGNMSGANGYMVNFASESLATQGATIGFNGMLSVGNVSLLQNLYVTGGSGAGYFDSLSATTFSAGAFSTTSLSAGTLTATTGTITNLSSTNLSATNATLTTATISGGNATLSTVTAGTGVITNLSSTNATLTTATISGGNATLSTITAGTGVITSFSVTTLNATGTSNVKDLNVNGNMSGANGYMVNFAAESLAVQGATVGFNGITSVGDVFLLQNLYATGYSGAAFFNEVHVSTGSLFIGNNVILSSPDYTNLSVNSGLNVGKGLVAPSGTIGVFTSTTAQITNLTTTTFTGSNIKATNVVLTTLTGTNATVQNVVLTTLTGTNGTITNLSTTNFTGVQAHVVDISVENSIMMSSGSYIGSATGADTLYVDCNMNVSNVFTVNAVNGLVEFSNFTGGVMYPGVTIDGVHGTIYCTGSTGVGYFNEVYVSTGSLYIGDNVVLSSPDNQFLNISRPIVVNSTTPSFTGGSGAGGAGEFVLTLTGTSVAGSIWLHTVGISTDDSPIVTVTFNNAYTTEPYVTFSAANTGSAGVYNSVYVETTPTDFSLKLVPAATLINGDVYKWNYNVMG